MRKVSAAVANREFSKILREVAAGETIIVTSRGKPVAEIRSPENSAAEANEDKRRAEFRAFLDGLRRQPAMNFPKATRGDMYD